MPGFGSRSWMENVQKTLHKKYKNNNGAGLSPSLKFYKELLIQGKKISQIICYIWSNNTTVTAGKLDKYFRGVEGKNLSDLLFAQPPVSTSTPDESTSTPDESTSTPDESYEYGLLKEVFSKNLKALPIFNEKDKDCVRFKVSVDRFEGSLDDPHPGEKKVLVITIPYPPMPTMVEDEVNPTTHKSIFKGYAPIKKTYLETWIDDQTYEPTTADQKIQYFPTNPYLPSSTS